jgi:hypothetical protein
MDHRLELVSLHIPKTAGTSLRGILLNQFGKGLAKLDLYDSGNLKLDDQPWKGHPWPNHVRAVHGHFKYASVAPLLPPPDQTPWMTWVRQPVERVVSNYYFLTEILADRIQEQPDENLWSRMGKTIEEFVVHPANQNVMSAFLRHAPLSSFAFVGIQDRFDSELQRMAQTLQWPLPQSRKDNSTRRKPPGIDAGLRRFIEAHNAEDMAVYEHALELRSKHPKTAQP